MTTDIGMQIGTFVAMWDGGIGKVTGYSLMAGSIFFIPMMNSFSDSYVKYSIQQLQGIQYSWREIGPIHAIQQQAEALKQVFTSDYLRTQIDQMQQSVDNNPTDAIGKAKELIESCCKTILEDKNVTVDEGWEIPRLLKETMAVVDVLPTGLQNAIVEDAVKKLLGNLSQMPFQIASTAVCRIQLPPRVPMSTTVPMHEMAAPVMLVTRLATAHECVSFHASRTLSTLYTHPTPGMAPMAVSLNQP